jgi:DinB superfamily
MNQADFVQLLELSRKRTNTLVDTIANRPDAPALLAWRPGAGRAHIAWQLMHIAATDDRHLNVRMRNGEPASAEFVRRFAGGSTPDDDIPAIDTIRNYLTQCRQAMLDHLRTLSDAQLATKPTPDAQWVYEEWFRVLAWHEAHHHGQAHLTFNLYRAATDSTPANG